MKIVFCLALLGCHAPRIGKLQWAQIVAGQFDAGTTYRVDHDYTDTWEMNPALKPFADNASIFPAMVASDWLAIKVEERLAVHHARWAKVISVAVIASHVYWGVRNIRLAESLPASRKR
jgi:hypothetical protein